MNNARFNIIKKYFKTLESYENQFNAVCFTFKNYKKYVKNVNGKSNTQIIKELRNNLKFIEKEKK